MSELIRRRPLTVFFVLAFVLGAIVTGVRLLDPGAMATVFKDMRTQPWHPNIVTVFPRVLDNPILWTGYLFPFAPTAAAIIVVALGWGRRGLAELFDRLKPWRQGVTWRQGLLVYALAFAVYYAAVAFLLIELTLKGPGSGLESMLARYGNSSLAIVGFLAVAPFLGPGGLLEELGWRGFMFPLLVEKLKTPLLACVAIGILWGLWHFPREIPSLLAGDWSRVKGGSPMGFVLNQVQFCIGTIVASIVIAYVFFKTGGSVWAAILVHNFGNEFSVGLGMLTKNGINVLGFATTPGDLVKFVLAVVIVAATGSQLGRDPGRRP